MRDPGRRALLRAAVALPAAAAVAGCAGLRGNVRIAVTWSGWELARFRDVLRAFTGRTGLDTEVVALGDDIGAIVDARASGAPDVVLLPRSGLVRQFHDRLEPVDWAWQRPAQFPPRWRRVLDVDGRLLGVPFKAANKTVLWYRTDVLDRPPTTWTDLLVECRRLVAAGLRPLALGAADGWPLSDLFENVLLGLDPSGYRELAAGRPRWARESVRQALTRLGELLSIDGVLAGGTQRALTTQFEDSLLQVFRHDEAAMVVAPDFAYPVIERYAELDDRVGLARFPVFPPATAASGATEAITPVMAGGDIAVLPKPGSAGGRELIGWLATAEAAGRWASRGGFLAPHLGVQPATYPDPRLADELRGPFEFDLSDELGGVGGLLWRVLQDFLATVGDGRADRVEGAMATAVRRMAAA
jgi:alpha-glucoside transport system substrate-binding protein